MLEHDEKATVTVEKADPSTPIAVDATDTDKASDIDSSKLNRHISDDDYPQGLRLVLLAGASLVAVFLIALDQVSTRLLYVIHPHSTTAANIDLI